MRSLAVRAILPAYDGDYRARAFIPCFESDERCPQLEQVMRYERDMVKIGMKKTVNFDARSSRCCSTYWPQ